MHFLKINFLLVSLFLSSNLFAIYFPNDTWEITSPEEQQVSSDKVDALIDLAFLDDATQAVVVIKNGKIISEQYAEGYGKDSHGTSWSMAKSYYAALIGISIDRGEIGSLDDEVSQYLKYFDDERSKITIRDLLNMSSGLDFPEDEHEKMFFQSDHLKYAKSVGVEKSTGLVFEYNNVNSMLLGDILLVATGKKADILLNERILEPIGVKDFKLWKDENGNVLTYCCVDMSARDYSKIGLLFARNGNWNGVQLLSKDFIDETFQLVWDLNIGDRIKRPGYSLHWWVSAYEDDFKIFNTSGKFGQFTFVDRKNDVIVTRITKYDQQDFGSTQKWGIMKYLRWAGIENAINIGRTLLESGAVESGTDIVSPFTSEEGESKIFYTKYEEFIDAIAELSRS